MKPEQDFDRVEFAMAIINNASTDVIAVERMGINDPAMSNKVCFMMARYSEEMIKAKLVLEGIRFQKSHNQVDLLSSLPDFPNKKRAIAIGAELTPYAVDAFYGYEADNEYTVEDAQNVYSKALEMPYLLELPGYDDKEYNYNKKSQGLWKRKLFGRKK